MRIVATSLLALLSPALAYSAPSVTCSTDVKTFEVPGRYIVTIDENGATEPVTESADTGLARVTFHGRGSDYTVMFGDVPVRISRSRPEVTAFVNPDHRFELKVENQPVTDDGRSGSLNDPAPAPAPDTNAMYAGRLKMIGLGAKVDESVLCRHLDPSIQQ